MIINIPYNGETGSVRVCVNGTTVDIPRGVDYKVDGKYAEVVLRSLEAREIPVETKEEWQEKERKTIGALGWKEVEGIISRVASKSGVILETTSGNPIVIADSAECEPVDMTIHGKSEQAQLTGKNLLNFPDHEEYTRNGVTVSFKNGLVTVKGTADSNGYNSASTDSDAIISDLLGMSGTFYKTGTVGEARVVIVVTKADGTTKYYGEDGIVTLEGTETMAKAYINVYAEKTVDCTLYPMLRYAEITDDTYEPYCGGVPSPNPEYPQEIINAGAYDEASGKYAVTVKCTGKNLINSTDLVENTINGVTFNPVYVDGFLEVIELNGTSNGYPIFKVGEVGLKSGKTYVLSGCDKAGGLNSYRLDLRKDEKLYNNLMDDGTGVAFTATEDITVDVYIRINLDYACSDVKIYPMLRFAEIANDTYEPYKESTVRVYLDEPLRKGDKVYWNGEKLMVERHRASILFDGSDDEGWTADYAKETGIRRCCIQNLKSVIKKATTNNLACDVLCDSYIAKSANATYLSTMGVSVDVNGLIHVYDDNFNTSDIALWEAHLAEHPVVFEYELATPITEEIDIDLGLTMFRPTTVMANDCGTEMEITYVADTKAYIDKKFAELATAML